MTHLLLAVFIARLPLRFQDTPELCELTEDIAEADLLHRLRSFATLSAHISFAVAIAFDRLPRLTAAPEFCRPKARRLLGVIAAEIAAVPTLSLFHHDLLDAFF